MVTETTSDEFSTRLRSVGLKVTAPRLAVLSALSTPGHFEVDEVYRRVSTTLPGTSLQTIYGVLSALSDTGLARRIEPAGSPALYESRTGDNHHHVVCSGCGRIEDVDCVVDESPCLTPSSAGGFAVHTAEVTFWGLCPACQAAAAH
ncbi:MAG: Fur family transcriptional regulator [Leifsonia sp.]